jgi:putative addiction module component (TIGR02574 family)
MAYNQGILRSPAELLSEALDLPAEARAALADSLLDSLDTEGDATAEDAWRDEIYLRLQEIDRGAARLIPWQDVQRRLRARLQQRRSRPNFLALNA